VNHDPEIQALIRHWTPPDPPPGIDSRMMARFYGRRRTFWKHRIELHISIPLPALAAAIILLLVGGLWFGIEEEARISFRQRMGGFEPVAAPRLITTARVTTTEAGR
jgi:hypothetical protein